MSTNTSWWSRLNGIDSVSSNFRYFLKPLQISDTEFCIVPPVRWPLGTQNDHKQFNGLYLYSTINDSWIEWIKYPDNLNIDSPASCIDYKLNIIYLYHSSGKLIKIFYKTKEIELISNMINLDNPRLCLIPDTNNSELHLIGGIINHKHLIFNEKEKKFKIYSSEFSRLPFTGGFNGFGLLHIPNNNLLLLFGGHKDEIYSFNLLTKEWNKTANKQYSIPEINNFGYVMTLNQKYLILMGGLLPTNNSLLIPGLNMDDIKLNNKIFIMDLNKRKWYQCKILTPSYSRSFRAIIMNNDNKQEIIVSGYIRFNLLKNIKNNKLFPPSYIIKLIQTWYKNEYLHLMEYSWHSKSHWKIKLDYILNNIIY